MYMRGVNSVKSAIADGLLLTAFLYPEVTNATFWELRSWRTEAKDMKKPQEGPWTPLTGGSSVTSTTAPQPRAPAPRSSRFLTQPGRGDAGGVSRVTGDPEPPPHPPFTSPPQPRSPPARRRRFKPLPAPRTANGSAALCRLRHRPC